MKPPVRGFRRLFRLSLRPADAARDLDEEVRLHLQLRAEQLEARGLSPDEARSEALRRFGDAETLARLRQDASRGRARLLRREWLDALWHDLRYAVRQLRSAPAFTAAAVLTFALALGANATMFGVVDRLLLRPPALLADPEATHRLYFRGTGRPTPEGYTPVETWLRFTELRDAVAPDSVVAALSIGSGAVGSGEAAREESVAAVSASTFRVFEVRPKLGRLFTEEEDRPPQGTPVVVLGHAYWRSAFGGSPDVLGRQLRVDGTFYTVIGVAPPEFSATSLTPVAAFVPLTAAAHEAFAERFLHSHGMRWLELIARRSPESSEAALQERLTAAYARSREQEPPQPGRRARDTEPPQVLVAPIPQGRTPTLGAEAQVAVWLSGMAVVVLLVACVNVTNLLLARSLRRHREVAVRLALGVSRLRLVAQLMVESVLLAVLGCAVGWAIAYRGSAALTRLLLPELEAGGAAPDERVLWVTLAAAVAAGLLAGLAPALQGARTPVGEALKSGSAQAGLVRSRLRSALLVIQVALCVVLLAGAGLFTRSLMNVRGLPLGYDVDRILYVEPQFGGTTLPPVEQQVLLERLRDQAAALPSVEAAALTSTVPFMISIREALFDRDGSELSGCEDCFTNAVSPEYFRTAGTRILRGRGIEPQDVTGAPPVLVVSESMARRLWPKADAIGQCLKIRSAEAPCSVVIGVAEDIRRSDDYAKPPPPQYYAAAAQRSDGARGIFVRMRGQARGQLEPVRRELQKLMPGSAYARVRVLEDQVDRSLSSWRLGATLLGVFGGLALLLAAVGMYGVIAFNVTQRTRELGVRAALGARTGDVLRLVLGEGARLSAIGVAIGAGAVLLGADHVAPLLFRVSARDPLTLSVVALTLLAVALLSTLIPAWRATRVPPGEALRAE